MIHAGYSKFFSATFAIELKCLFSNTIRISGVHCFSTSAIWTFLTSKKPDYKSDTQTNKNNYSNHYSFLSVYCVGTNSHSITSPSINPTITMQTTNSVDSVHSLHINFPFFYHLYVNVIVASHLKQSNFMTVAS